jgi:ADP-heptose:LPS heptosyltransferase
MHAKDTYLALIKRFTDEKKILKSEFIITEEEKNKWESLRISPSLFIACASRALQKRYPYSYLKTVIKDLKKDFSIVILGQEDERDFYKDILTLEGITDLVGKTTIYEVHYLLKQYAKFLLCVDSSILHLGSYLNIPMVAIFGPTDIFRYGPWSDRFKIVRNEALPCVPCQKPHCSLKHKCMDIHPEIVIKAARELLKA